VEVTPDAPDLFALAGVRGLQQWLLASACSLVAKTKKTSSHQEAGIHVTDVAQNFHINMWQ
jgi:hypothetical protein